MIDQALVHRTMEREVFVVDREHLDHSAMRIDVCVPGFHPRVRQAGSELPLIVLLEIWRQAGFLLSHELATVPVDWRFVTGRLSATWITSPPVVPALGAIWCELLARIHASKRRDEELRLEWRFDLAEDGEHVATGSARSVARSPAAYDHWHGRTVGLRAHRAAAPQPLGPGANAVTWDTDDPFLADMPGDRVGSLVLAHAALTHSATPSHPARFDLECLTPAAHGRRLEMRPTSRSRSRIALYEVTQDGTRVANARVLAAGPR